MQRLRGESESILPNYRVRQRVAFTDRRYEIKWWNEEFTYGYIWLEGS